jgi:hypothetical protein
VTFEDSCKFLPFRSLLTVTGFGPFARLSKLSTIVISSTMDIFATISTQHVEFALQFTYGRFSHIFLLILLTESLKLSPEFSLKLFMSTILEPICRISTAYFYSRGWISCKIWMVRFSSHIMFPMISIVLSIITRLLETDMQTISIHAIENEWKTLIEK